MFVQGGGCSGFQYGFTFDENIEEGDTRVENHGVTLLIDPMSIQYLAGAEIDYREDMEGAQFVIRNPERHHDLRLRLLFLGVSRSLWCALDCRQWFSDRSSPTIDLHGPRQVPDVIAAVDLGSNSFHMVVARYSHGQLMILDRLREMVRLARRAR